MTTATFTVRFTIEDESDDPIHPEIALLDLLSNAGSDQHCQWEIVPDAEQVSKREQS